MPVYPYQCKKCGEFEEIQRITDKPLKKCPKCKGPIKKLIAGNTRFQLVGGGWCKDGYSR